MQREEALEMLQDNLKSENLLKHCYASEAVMRRLAREKGEDEDLWGLTGLLHDLDLEITGDDMSVHADTAARMLEERGEPAEMVDAVRMHNAEGLGLGELVWRHMSGQQHQTVPISQFALWVVECL